MVLRDSSVRSAMFIESEPLEYYSSSARSGMSGFQQVAEMADADFVSMPLLTELGWQDDGLAIDMALLKELNFQRSGRYSHGVDLGFIIAALQGFSAALTAPQIRPAGGPWV
jgi:hypothetical protein